MATQEPFSWKALAPLGFLVLLVAVWPPVGGVLVAMGLLSLWSKRAAGTWPWQAQFWDAMQWTVVGALGIGTLGVILHEFAVRPLWQGARQALGW